MKVCTCGNVWMLVGAIPPCPVHGTPAKAVITYAIPQGAMRVAPGTDALVWRINPDKCGEL